MKIGTYIKQERKFRNLTIAQLSEMSGVSKSALSRIERNESAQFEPISRILSALDLDAAAATNAGVNWWTDDSSVVEDSEDLAVIVEWLRAQDVSTIKTLRDVVDYLKTKED